MAQVTSPAAGIAGLLVMSYDITGLATVHVEGWPLLAWSINETNPQNPIPVTIGAPNLTSSPATGQIISPPWVYIVSDDAVYAPDGWRGTLYDFFTWLATNNGANRKLSAALTLPVIYNVWHRWARENPLLVAPMTMIGGG